STPDRVFGGFVIAIEDGYSYLAKMNEGAHGAWSFTLPYTSEAHTPTIFYLFHLLLGKVAALFNSPLTVMYHLARLILDALLLAVIYRFVAQFAASRAVRKIAWLIITFSGGLGWLLLLAGQPNWLDSAPIDLISPEAFTFLILYAFPHLALARTLMLLGLLAWWGKRRAVVAGVCWLAMGVIVPFYVAVVGAIVIAGLIADSIARRSIAWREVRGAMVAGLIASPMLIYTFMIVATDPIWNVWQAQLIILSPHPLHYIAGYALVGALAVIGLLRNQKSEIRNPKLIGWLLVVPVLIYLPFNSQRRLIEGWQMPLAIFAASALVYRALPAWRRSRLVRRLIQYRRYSVRGLTTWAIAGGLIVTSATYVLLLVEQSARMIAQLPPSFRDGREIEALRWLDGQVKSNAVVLSSYDTGNFLPTVVAARAFTGHGPETAYSDDKRQLATEFYGTQTTDAWRRAFVRRWPIDWVIAGPLEAKLGAVDFVSADYLTLEYEREGYRIYRVER
ncbi:MAG TPA: hypothetical protein VFF59_13025, partial [Anaerolineae bacterium]|nr:hypothetical protein [Anaerolineae bacterium]